MCVYSTSNFVCGHSLSTWQYCEDATYQDVVVREVAREPRSGRFNRTSNSTSRSSRSSTSRSSTSRSPHRHARRRHDPLTSPSSSPTSPTSPGLALSVEGSSSPKEKNPDMEPFSSPPEQQQQRRRSPASPSPNQSSASPPPAFSSPPSSPSFIRDEEAQPEYIRHTARSRTRRRSNSFSSPSPLTTSTSPSREGQPNSPRNHVSRARLPCKHVKRTSKDSDKACSSRFNCNLKRVKNCWTCCQCGHGPNRFVNCTGRVPKDRGNGDDDEENKDKDGDVVMKEEGEGTKEEDATAVFDDDDDKTYCPHMICPECKPLVIPPIPVYDPTIGDWATPDKKAPALSSPSGEEEAKDEDEPQLPQLPSLTPSTFRASVAINDVSPRRFIRGRSPARQGPSSSRRSPSPSPSRKPIWRK